MMIFKKLRDKNNEFDNLDIIVRTDEVCIGEILEDFKSFLMGCGYPIEFTDRLELIKEEDET